MKILLIALVCSVVYNIIQHYQKKDLREELEAIIDDDSIFIP